MNIKILDCTLRDGAYIVNGEFGEASIRGIIDKLTDSRIDIVEVGWLKNEEHKNGTTYYHVPSDVNIYMKKKNSNTMYCMMIDYNRYDLKYLPQNDGKSIDAIRIVFPYGKYKEGLEVGRGIREKGYKVYFQLANTLNYTNDDLKNVIDEMNEFKPEGIYMVDTFGAMYEDDVDRIASFINNNLDINIAFGIHTHNNQQLAFSNAASFIKVIEKTNDKREILIDSSLNGMGRGAGNATTELVVNFLNKKYDKHYDLDSVMDAIDLYMSYFKEKYSWGYSTPYFIAGIYTTHVNNIAYLLNNHNTSHKDMRNIIESMGEKERRAYNYDYLENKYVENQNKTIDDSEAIEKLRNEIVNTGKKILLVAPGRSSIDKKVEIDKFVNENKPIVIGVNAILPTYKYDYLFFVNKGRYEYAENAYKDVFDKTKKIVLSNIKTGAHAGEYIVSYNHAIKRGFMHFDNAVICALRFLDFLYENSNVRESLQLQKSVGVSLRARSKDDNKSENEFGKIYICGFDGFLDKYNESYADVHLPSLNVDTEWGKLNEEIKEMYNDVKENKNNIEIKFITSSVFE